MRMEYIRIRFLQVRLTQRKGIFYSWAIFYYDGVSGLKFKALFGKLISGLCRQLVEDQAAAYVIGKLFRFAGEGRSIPTAAKSLMMEQS
jgi:hypothetical protein